MYWDVDGFDTGKKISILSSMALGRKVNHEDVYTEGISKVTTEDTKYAEELGCVIKLIGKFRQTENEPEVIVAPMFVNEGSPLYGIDDVFNGICVTGDMLGESLFYGKGAGMLATASAVVSDVMEAVKGSDDDVTVPWVNSNERIIKNYSEVCGRFFVRIKNTPDMFSLALERFNNERTIEIIDGEFALITQELTVAELEKALAGIDVISKYMFV